MIKYKIPGKEILRALKEKGYSSTYLVKNRIFGEKTLTYLRHDKLVRIETIDKLCELLNCQISDLIYYEKTSDSKFKFDYQIISSSIKCGISDVDKNIRKSIKEIDSNIKKGGF